MVAAPPSAAETVVARRPSPPQPPPPSGFPAPGREAVADLRLDEPSAGLEPVHEGAPEEAASLETAQIRVDKPGGRGGRFSGQ